MMNAQYFINKFEQIPAGQFCSRYFTNSHGQKCANGHCGITNDDNNVWYTTHESRAFYHVLKGLVVTDYSGELLTDYGDSEYSRKAAFINNNMCREYNQFMIKDRILAALKDAYLLEIQEGAVKEAKRILQTAKFVSYELEKA